MAIGTHDNLYGVTGSGGTNGDGLAYKLAQIGQSWILTPLYNFLGGLGGQNPSSEIIGPDEMLYGSANGGLQNCGTSGNGYCGIVYRLRPPPAACLTALCSWNQAVIYEFTEAPDGSQPNGNLIFDSAGNLYGTTTSGGTYGQGTVYELTPVNGGWTEKVIYSFTGAGDGAHPSSLLLGQDGNLYGTTWTNDSGAGAIFQLVPFGDSWTENTISEYAGCSEYSGVCYPVLIEENRGSFYGLSNYTFQVCNPGCQPYGYTASQIFMMSPTQSSWQFTVLDDTYTEFCSDRDWCNDPGYAVFRGIAVDAAGDLYGTVGSDEICPYCFGFVFKLLGPYQEQPLAEFRGDDFVNVEVSKSDALYGTTGACGRSAGTVWQLAPP